MTQRERDILELVANGFFNREIAERLFLGEGTVRNTFSVILEKLVLRDRTQLAIYYWRRKQDIQNRIKRSYLTNTNETIEQSVK